MVVGLYLSTQRLIVVYVYVLCNIWKEEKVSGESRRVGMNQEARPARHSREKLFLLVE